MKRFLSLFVAFFMVISLFGCAEKNSSVELKKNVTFQLSDVMIITNDESNSIYYYYMATITNDSKKTYSTNNVSYKITDNKDEDIKPIDQHESMPILSVMPEQTAYVYGYVGFPNNNQEDMGFYFKDQDEFISFNSIDVRKATNHDILDSEKQVYTFYEDDALQILVNGKDCTSEFSNGTTTINNFKITYKNKTDRQIVVPYLEPQATLRGILLTDYKDKGDFSKMSEEELKKVDFSKKDLAPKTEEIGGQAFGYVVEYLDPEQEIECNVGFTFKNGAINYKSNDKNCIDVDLISSAFGVTNTMTVSYQ